MLWFQTFSKTDVKFWRKTCTENPIVYIAAYIWLHLWSLRIDDYINPTPYNGCNYLSMLELLLIYVSKRGLRCVYGVGVGVGDF